MFELLRDVGQYLSPVSSEPVQMMAEPIGEKYVYGIAICFNKEGEYKGVRLRSGNSDVIFKNPHSSTPHSYTFVLRLSENTDNVFNRLKRTADKIKEAIPDGANLHLMDLCYEKAEQNKDRIIADIERIIPDDTSKDKRCYVYWGLIEEERIIGFYTFPEVKEFLVRAKMNAYGTKDNRNLELTNHVCSVCGKKAEKVYGNFTEIQCYNLDKCGVVTGGFNYSQAPANFPICQECILLVLAGKSYTENNLSFYIAGHTYWLLPQTTNPALFKIVMESIIESQSRHSLGKELDTITGYEEEILEIIASKMESSPELITLNFIFYKSKPGSAEWRIRSEIREVLPSRISNLYKVKKSIQSKEEMSISKKERENGYRFTLNTIHRFCGEWDIKGKQKKDEKKFMAYVESIFKCTKMRESIVIRDLANGIVDAQKDDLRKNMNNHIFRVRDAWATYLFLSKVETLDKRGDNIMSKRYSADVYSQYMDKSPEFFNNKYRKAAFLTGCFVNSVLYVQRDKRNSQPFEKKFMGRKLNGKSIEDLYRQGETKLRQYGKLGIVSQLNPIVADSLVSCGGKWEISDDETTFAFALGVALGPKLASKKSESNEVKK